MKARMVLVAALLSIAGSSDASVRSKMLYSRGVLELNAGRLEAALALFDQAVAADPSDGYALYYRGIARGRLRDSDGAIADLTAALNVQPTLSRAALELGIALVQKEQYDDAVTFLERARKRPELEARASFFLGICRLRRGEYGQATALFDRAAAEDPQLATSSHYYRGIIAYRQGDRSRAIEHFQTVVDKAADSQIGHEAKKIVEALRAAARPWQLFAASGFQYDSNVVLGPGANVNVGTADDPAFVTGEGDGRVLFSLGGRYRLIDREWTALSVGYDFYQSLHLKLSEFNIQNHGAALDFELTGDFASGGVLARHDFALRKTDKFLQSGTILPWISIPAPQARWAETQLSFRLLLNDFYGGDVTGEDFDVRDAYNYAAAVREVLNIGASRYLWVGYRFDNEDPVGDDDGSQSFGYDGHQVETGFTWTLPSAYGVEVGYAYRNERYNDESRIPPPPLPPTPLRPRRSDNVHNVFVLLHIPLPSVFELTVGFFSTFNNSNQVEFDYERLVGTTSIGARL